LAAHANGPGTPSLSAAFCDAGTGAEQNIREGEMARILLVEDDRDVRPLMEHLIANDGHQVIAVETVRNAIELLAEQPFDLVVTDANLPDGSGLKIADKAKEMAVKALVITGHGLSLKPGALASYDYLLKPLRAAELLDGVRKRLPREEGGVVKFPKA
jgi:DNA-binding NtrC family response regulator